MLKKFRFLIMAIVQSKSIKTIFGFIACFWIGKMYLISSELEVYLSFKNHIFTYYISIFVIGVLISCVIAIILLVAWLIYDEIRARYIELSK